MTDEVLSFCCIDSSFCEARQILDKNMVFGFRHNRRVYRSFHPFTHY
jgi:hypothetical protein